jgi:hypothetical protein
MVNLAAKEIRARDGQVCCVMSQNGSQLRGYVTQSGRQYSAAATSFLEDRERRTCARARLLARSPLGLRSADLPNLDACARNSARIDAQPKVLAACASRPRKPCSTVDSA